MKSVWLKSEEKNKLDMLFFLSELLHDVTI